MNLANMASYPRFPDERTFSAIASFIVYADFEALMMADGGRTEREHICFNYEWQTACSAVVIALTDFRNIHVNYRSNTDKDGVP